MENFCYHGIGTNLLRFESILEHGILTKAFGYRSTAFHVNGEQCYNGTHNVSVVIPHRIKNDKTQNDAMSIYVLKGIAFLVTNTYYRHSYYTDSYSGFFDEGYVNHPIPPSDISGIIIPKSLRNKKISELEITNGSATDCIVPIAQSIIDTLIEKGIDPNSFADTRELMNELNTICTSTNLSYTQQKNLIKQSQKRLDTNLGKKLESYYQQKLGKSDISLMDVITHYNKSQLPIYDEYDVKKQCKKYTDNIPEYIKKDYSHSGNKSITDYYPTLDISYFDVAKKCRGSIVTNTRTSLTAYMNKLHEKNLRLR